MSDKLFWTIVFILLSATAGWNIYQNQLLRQQVATPDTGLENALLETRIYELSYSGRTLQWPDGLKVLGPEPVAQEQPGYRLILVVDELSCDACRDDQTQFALRLARDLNEEVVRIVVSAGNIMYARGYMRLNQVELPVYYDEERRFFEANKIGSTPLMMLVNPRDEVIAAHFPIPEQPHVSKPFHNFCRHFFGLPIEPDTVTGEP